MTKQEGRSAWEIIIAARYAIPLSVDALCIKLNTSTRTLQRWQAGESKPSSEQLIELVRLVHPRGGSAPTETVQR